MSDESIKNAVRFIGTELKDNPDANKMKLIEEACQKYDLTPMQSDFLVNKFC